MKTSAHFTLYSSVLLLSSNGLFANGIPLDAASIIHIRCIFAVFTLAIFIFITKGRFSLSNKTTGITVYIIGLLMGLHWLTFFYAIQSSSVAIGILALYTFPIITLFIEPFFTRKNIQVIDIFLGLLILIGIYIIAKNHLPTGQESFNPQVIYGIFSGIVSAIFFAFRNLLQKYRCPDISSDTLMFHQMIIVIIMMTLLIDIEAISALDSKFWPYLLLLGIVTTALAHTLLVKSYKLFTAKTVSMVSCSQPVLASILAWIILSEPLAITTIIGGSIILGVAAYESTKVSIL